MDLQEQYERLLRYCYMKIGDAHLVEDIVQETFLRFWQNHTYEDIGKEMAYLYTIARNLCMDELRREKHENIEDYPEVSDGKMPEQDRMVNEMAIERAMEQLPEELRELIALRYISGISAADIGKIMGMSRFAVHRRLKEGLQLLKKELE